MSRPKSHSRLRPSASSQPYLPDGPADLLPDGPVDEETAELIHEFVHPHRHDSEDTLVDDQPDPDDQQIEQEWQRRAHLPWWRRPSAYWFLAIVPFSSMTMSATIAPRIEIFTRLACQIHKPEYTAHGPTDAGVYLPSVASTSYSPPGPHGILDSVLNGSADYTKPEGLVSITYTPTERALYKKQQSLCASDPVVQAAVAKLSAVTTATMGILGFITTAWWSSLSDRHGRLFVLRFTVVGLLISMINFIFVAHYAKHIPGGYWFLLASSVTEGALGGITTAAAATHAYIADCTPPASRSRLFSLQLGLLFIGTAVGPTLGSLLVRWTEDLLTIFYVALVIDCAYAFMLWFVIPESMTPAEMRRARRNGESRRGGILGLFSPLSVFVPVRTRKGGRDWSLTLVAASFGMVVLNFGGLPYKFQYVASRFGWGSEKLGYWLSLAGAARAFHLTVVLPLFIHLFKPKPPAIQLPTTPDEPLSSSPSPSPATKPALKRATPAFDLLVARISLFVEVIAYTTMPLASNGILFSGAAVLGSFGSGFAPAAQSLALELYARQGGAETGRLFGAWSVVQVVSTQVLGPALYGVMYMKTVKTFPQAIFFLSAAGVATSFVLLSLIRLPKEGGDTEEGEVRGVLVETLVEDEDRGRRGQPKIVVVPASDE